MSRERVEQGVGRRAPRSSRRRALLLALGGACAAWQAPGWAAALGGRGAGFALDAQDRLAVVLGDVGPRLIAAGAIDPQRLAAVAAGAGTPLDARAVRLLTAGGDDAVAFDAKHAWFLLNVFWGLGLANANPLLTAGPMVRGGWARLRTYASTGGYTLGARPVLDVYASSALVTLSAPQQQRLAAVAADVYRPCCDNPTSFPDCNHGMAMLGLLTLVAARDADADALHRAAVAANRVWFPQAAAQVASYVRATQAGDQGGNDPRAANGRELFSATGYRKVAAWAQGRPFGPAAAGTAC